MLIYTLSAFCASMLVTAAEAADPVSLTDVIKLQMPCPIYECMYLACPSGQYKTNYVTINGRQCPSCQTCVDTASITARKISPNLLPCPIFECKFCPSGNYERNHITVNGQACPACGTCLDSLILSGRDIEDVECPAPMCAATNECDQADLVVSYFDFNGKECPGCKMCPM